MNDLDVIDQFLNSFSTYIDSGFGLVSADVHSLTALLIGLDAALAGLFWVFNGEQDVVGRFVRKILYVGAFAYLLNNFASLTSIIYRSFAAIGLEAGGSAMSSADLLKPGKLAGTGFTAAWPLLNQASQLVGFTSFFDNALTIMVLLFAWAIVVLAFFILAVQLFVTILEFKLTSLTGFVLVPFALWNRTSFLAERVLGNVVGSGVKVMVLAVIVGIGSTFFNQFTTAIPSGQATIAQAMSLALAALSLLGLGIFGPGIASGLIAGAPQLGAGAVAGTAIGAGATMALGTAAVTGAAGAAAGGTLAAVRAGTSMGAASSTAWSPGQAAAGETSVRAGIGGLAQAAGQAVRSHVSNAIGFDEAVAAGRSRVLRTKTSTADRHEAASGPRSNVPDWAQRLHAERVNQQNRRTATETLKGGDGAGAGAVPDLSEKED